jgi:hypothetical protein
MTYDKLFKVENLDHISGQTDHINVTVGYNISDKSGIFHINDLNKYVTANTGSFTPTTAGQERLCGWIINASTDFDATIVCKNFIVIDTTKIQCNITSSISTEKFIYENGEPVKFYNLLNNETLPYKIEYWIEDLFGNVVKKRYNTTNTNQKSFTKKIEEQDSVFLIKNQVYPLCDDINNSDNKAKRLFIIKGTEPLSESFIEIKKVYTGSDNKVKFGETFEVKAVIYKGDETKNQVQAWVEDNGNKITSKTTKFMLYDPFISYELTVPLHLKEYCNKPTKSYSIVIKAFDITEKASVNVEEISCSSSSSTRKASAKDSSFVYSLVDFPQTIKQNSMFTTQVEITNNDDKAHTATLWSYVYRGNKCYSGHRTENQHKIQLPKESSVVSTLSNMVDAEPGFYKFKVKILKDNQVTEKEITRDIQVIDSFTKMERVDNPMPLQNIQNNQINISPGIIYKQPRYEKIIYESSSYKASKLIPNFIIFLLVSFILYLLFNKNLA